MSSENDTTLTRRQVTALSIASLIVAENLGKAVFGLRKNPQQPEKETTFTPVFSFGDKDLDEVAKQANITPGDFFKFSAKTLEKVKAQTKDELYPIFPPSVLHHRRLIYDLSREFNIPPNIIAVIMTIESCGNVYAESGAGAQGLFQVMPFHFRSEIQRNSAAMKNPEENGRVGMRYFVRDCLSSARTALKGYPSDHPAVYARALMAYNGGPGQASASFDNLPEETKFYGDHLIRFVLTAQLADKLRHDKKLNDSQIVKKLSSAEVDARAFALSQFIEGRGRVYPYTDYERVIAELSKLTPGSPYLFDYQSYRSQPSYKVPVSPGLRIWLNMGGIDLFSKDPRNLDPNFGSFISTSR